MLDKKLKKNPSSGVSLEYSLSSAVNSQPDRIVDNDESRLDAEQQKPCFLSFLFLNSAHCSKRSLSQIWILAFLISAEAAATAAPTNIRLCRRLQTDSRRKAEGTFPPPLCAMLALPGCNGRGRRHLKAWGREVETEGGVGGVVQGDEKCRKLSPTFPFPPPSYPPPGRCSALQQK